jgi:deoxyribodipyrimidine photo-lyase
MPPTPSPPAFEPTRAAALRRLARFAPRAGRDYAAGRGFDYGPDRPRKVSGLSPYLRHRLVGEEEVLAAVAARHGPGEADRFVHEVLWRTYWKGWLELRPTVWSRYRRETGELVAALDRDEAARDAYLRAVEGRTGLEGFDDWAREVAATGYLHNHARMWFASIWIFTLRLPWQLGADFFLRHLLDGDPASNTLSWRWVAGLQTRGKTYVATAKNIAHHTGQRFAPKGLAARCEPLVEDLDTSPGPLPPAGAALSGPVGLLLTEDDLLPETLPLGRARVAAVAGAHAAAQRSPLPVSEPVLRFTDAALADALARAEAHHDAPASRLDALDHGAVGEWARAHGLAAVVTPYAPVGPAAERLALVEEGLAGAGIHLMRLRRPWDERAWPLATKGYFPFRDRWLAVLESESRRGEIAA